jgi:hypothetical protein
MEKEPANLKKITYWVHAVQRMYARGIGTADVRAVLEGGKTIEAYPEEASASGRLILGWHGERPLHVVAGDASAGETVIVTVYEPDPEQWEAGFERRKR